MGPMVGKVRRYRGLLPRALGHPILELAPASALEVVQGWECGWAAGVAGARVVHREHCV